MRILTKILSTLRYLAVLPLILVLGFVTLPLTLLFKWNGIWILCIANEEGCSISKAKSLFNKGKYVLRTSSSAKSSLGYNNIIKIVPHDPVLNDQYTNYMYRHLSFNIFHRN